MIVNWLIRNVLAATNHLHGAIGDLRNRIRELEGSLNNLHLVRMGSTHPLLRIQNDDDEEAIDDLSNVMASQRLESNVSTLAIAGDSSLRYFGTISGAFVLSTQVRICDDPPQLDYSHIIQPFADRLP
jgi:hypothetical protein